jgi:serpin B
MKTSSKILVAITLLALLGSTLAACSGKATQEPQDRTQAQSSMQRETAPQAHPAELKELAYRNSVFALNLYQELCGVEGNLFYSPYSISLALGMTYAGAQGETERQMAETLQFALPQERLHAVFNALDTALAQQNGEDFRLNVANSLWGQQNYQFMTDFLDTLAANYGAGLRLLDFMQEPEPSRQTINDWVSEQTEDRIKDLIPEGAITPATRLVLANAIYFDAKWQQPFDADLTRDGAFYTLDGKEVTAPMMNMSKPPTLSYTQGQGYQAVELPYKGGQASMLLIVPDQGQFESFEAELDAEQVRSIVGALEPQEVELTMPKFSFEANASLAPTLANMGMPDAFGDAADFSGMTGDRSLFISDVFHKAFVAVDEAGTEAAAATAVVMAEMALPISNIVLTVDRPFVFMIRDTESGALLFVGRVVEL